MKRILLLLLFSAIPVAAVEAAPHVDVAVGISVFHSSLAPYGEWVNSDFGHAWRPRHVVHGWRPYMNGRWACTDYGWYWISYEPFGWATFHYGRWAYDDYYGWIWIPDDVWGPSWVEWRYDDDYIGWAPLPPYASFNISVGIVFTRHWMAPVHYWNFVSCRHFTSARIVDHVQPVERTRRIFGNTRTGDIIRTQDHRVYNRGIDVRTIERRTNSRIERADVVATDRSRGDRLVRTDGRSRIESYRPRLDGNARDEEIRTPRSPGDDRTERGDRTTRIPDNPAGDRQSGRERMGREAAPPAGDRVIGRERQGVREAPDRPSADRQRDEALQRRQAQWQRQQDRFDQMREEQIRGQRSRDAQRESRPQPQVRERQQTREQPQMRPQPQVRERPRPEQRQPGSRDGGREGRRRG